jgi:Saccharopine dehydrogenase NADP binding domain
MRSGCTAPRVVVVGASGEFGARISRLLVAAPRTPGTRIVVTSRDADRASRLASTLADPCVVPAVLDHTTADSLARLAALEPDVIIDAAGPFDLRDSRLARAAIDLRSHYIDLADARTQVARITSLDAAARRAGVLVTSGASTVPAVTTAVLDALLDDGAALERVDVGISPGFRGPRGMATVQSILASCGEPVPQRPGDRRSTRGWGGLRLHRYPPPMGVRLLYYVDVPELDLWPQRFHLLERLTVRAGLEVPWLHIGLTLLARLRAAGCISNLASRAERLRRWADRCERFGTDTGGMHVRACVRDPAGARSERTWTLVVRAGQGPVVPATPAALLAMKLLAAPSHAPLGIRGARPCMGLLTLAELARQWRGLPVCIGRVDRALQPASLPQGAQAFRVDRFRPGEGP